MYAFDVATADGKEAVLETELESFFSAQNDSSINGVTSIPATFLHVTAVK